MKLLKTYIEYIKENATNIDIPSNNELLDMLKKNFPNYTKPNTAFPIEVKNTDGDIIKHINIHIDDNGKLQINTKIMESNKLTKGLAALCLIGGMLTSCTKDEKTYGYNIGTSVASYSIDNTNSNKEFTVFDNEGGIKKAKVDTFSKVGGNKIGAHGMVFSRPITPTEACILKAGAVYGKESAMNKKNDTKIIVAIPSIVKQPYTNTESSYTDCRTSPDFRNGLIALQIKGSDIESMLKQADKEVANQKWYTFDDDDKKNKENSELNTNPVNIDISNYALILKGFDIKTGARFVSLEYEGKNLALRNFTDFNLRIPKHNVLALDNKGTKELSYNLETKKWTDGTVNYTIEWNGSILVIKNDGFITKYNIYGVAR